MAAPAAITRTERTYYLIVALWSFPGWFMHPIYPMFLLSRGLDLFPDQRHSGDLSDQHVCVRGPDGRRRRRLRPEDLVSALVRDPAGGVRAVLLRGRVLGCAVAEIIDAIGLTLATGALEAWAVDGARAEGDLRPPIACSHAPPW